MAQQQPPKSPQGGQSGNKNQQNQSKLLIRPNYNMAFSAGSYTLAIEVDLFFQGQPLANQEVVLKEGISILDQQVTDNDGTAVLKATGTQTDVEKTEVLRIVLPGKPDEKVITIKIPAIKKVVRSKKEFTVRPIVITDSKAGTFEATFEVTVLDEGQPLTNQDAVFQEGSGVLDTKPLDNDGHVVFKTGGNLGSAERTAIYRFSLAHLTDAIEVPIMIPAAEPKPKEDKDPESLLLTRYHDGHGNFRVLARVLRADGVGVKTDVDIWYRGTLTTKKTNAKGVVSFDIVNPPQPGEDFILSAYVSGIEDSARLKIERRRIRPVLLPWRFYIGHRLITLPSRWSLLNNNGRARWLLVAMVSFWLLALIFGVGRGLLNEGTFREKETKLSKQEQIVNQTIQQAYPEKDKSDPVFFTPQRVGGNWQKYFWRIAVVLTLIALVYVPLSWREEIRDSLEDAIHSILERDSSRSQDPFMERLGKWVGTFHTARRAQSAVIMGSTSTAPVVNPPDGRPLSSTHPTLGQMFQMDLISDMLVSTVTALFRRIR